ncbi:hypothetical protein RND71_019116 [Anisodus tanguticus]|uniref:Uncharacterized protein n=1 Tax=Anisodus tanguticus TaxID=243964 RepID=A0AAE1RWX3_9SOLA|nr:hypothetical protein RND71_019116 [Anisodus tanguticus]
MDATNRLSAIAAEMGQLQNQIQEHCRLLNFLLISVRTMDRISGDKADVVSQKLGFDGICRADPMGFSEEKGRARWEERLRAACGAHVRHSRVAHAAERAPMR